MSIKVLILSGDGINCERETSQAFERSGGECHIIHINELINSPQVLHQYDILALPGGFSFGDELGSGKILSLKLKYSLGNEFQKFVDDKKPILGICNGFQVLVQLGVFDSTTDQRTLSLTQNQSGEFINRWSKLNTNTNTICKWIDKDTMSELELPIRHGEGNLQSSHIKTIDQLESNGQVVFRYQRDENGAVNQIAGICDSTGLILGMMPHPEAAFFQATEKVPSPTPHELGQGAPLFHTIINYVRKSKERL